MLGTESSPGILRMGIEDVFRTICGTPDREFLLRISYMEIYNETIKDLLCNDITKKKPLVVREDINRTVYVEDLIEEVVVSPEEAMRWLQKGEKNRHYGETKMSAKSSRSHTIFRMIIESKEDDSSSSDGDGAVMVSHLAISLLELPYRHLSLSGRTRTHTLTASSLAIAAAAREPPSCSAAVPAFESVLIGRASYVPPPRWTRQAATSNTVSTI
ncbi:centromere-associated protein E-like [Sphaerodactylus townsendi]|uniref:centromere-associated protein E-like n=1 Tax=Sphaerodactylus townsendi TaxID=933632 RepID=UPI002026781B|nr:centromere-associated protein E-like [Sphaerodactylus townsendi]